MKIEAVIFDLDGVLIDAKEWHYEALNQALGLFGYSISRYDHLVTYDGLPTRKKLEMLSRERGLPKSLHSFVNQLKQQYTMEMIFMNCKPLFSHEYALAGLKKKGYKLAVCSNSIRPSVDIMLKKSNLDHYFELTLSNEDVKRAKPDPEIYLKAIHQLGLKASQCLIIEDNDHGVKAAQDSAAHLLRVKSVSDVNLSNINKRIDEIEKGNTL
jgi:beta-phosphoglucomutase